MPTISTVLTQHKNVNINVFRHDETNAPLGKFSHHYHVFCVWKQHMISAFGWNEDVWIKF